MRASPKRAIGVILETGYLLCDMLSSINDSKSCVLFCFLFRIKKGHVRDDVHLTSAGLKSASK